MVKRIMRSLAPKGYHAVVDRSKDGCTGCAFESGTRCGMDRRCAPCERPDGRRVIFVINKGGRK